jgi:hypothetical protein
MHNPWKLATLGIGLMTTTALVTGVTTARLVGPAAEDAAPSMSGPSTAVAAPAVRRAGMPAASARQPAAVRRVAYEPAASVPADCERGTDRAVRIAKPGVIGTLIGAGVGAAGGAIADGGKAAGKGALIGGLAGAALGTGYGAYKTQQECGTIFGDGGSPRTVSVPSFRPVEPARGPVAASTDRITIYPAR